ncbi:TIGR03620 family F420-dependent LLM class oxidoreductase [Actinoallomurus purpureus]|uniref:TIGR03620 family F420-dependent LLM class oxidoreductase n=1 Tax=Actinoallomurus purpureus TaxID=478114 RepID=UPI0020938289|nr:TIGR03620 family F420-dependent LLM class oxidoreductase [Actinoallomurus purpureus]MCO6005549.1 TIGR03620 family F420-dependent LLM class oxidoreductase [Actinoallomurus purpureus]
MVVDEARQRLGRFGVWIPPQSLLVTPVAVQRREFARIERLGYGSLWSGEPPSSSPGAGREALVQHGLMLAATERIVVGTGIANIGMRDPVAMHAGAATLAEAYPGRFILGLGGQTGDRPLAQLRDYLDAMDAAATRLLPEIRYPRVLAALGPKAHALAAERADGVHPFLQPVEHTARARTSLGDDKLLIPHQVVVLETDPAAARGRLRAMLGAGRQGMDSPYTRHYRRLGYGDEDLAGDRSDRLIDAILAWGDEKTAASRIRAHLDAGADHVLVHPLAADLPTMVDQLERLADPLPL